MKKSIFAGILVGVLLILCGCTGMSDKKLPETSTDSEFVETFWSSSPRFPETKDDEACCLPLPLFFYDGRLYRPADVVLQSVEHEWRFVGRVKRQLLTTETPKAEFESNYITVGAPVYSDGEDNYLIAILQNDRYVVYEWYYTE